MGTGGVGRVTRGSRLNIFVLLQFPGGRRMVQVTRRADGSRGNIQESGLLS